MIYRAPAMLACTTSKPQKTREAKDTVQAHEIQRTSAPLLLYHKHQVIQGGYETDVSQANHQAKREGYVR